MCHVSVCISFSSKLSWPEPNKAVVSKHVIARVYGYAYCTKTDRAILFSRSGGEICHIKSSSDRFFGNELTVFNGRHVFDRKLDFSSSRCCPKLLHAPEIISILRQMRSDLPFLFLWWERYTMNLLGQREAISW